MHGQAVQICTKLYAILQLQLNDNDILITSCCVSLRSLTVRGKGFFSCLYCILLAV